MRTFFLFAFLVIAFCPVASAQSKSTDNVLNFVTDDYVAGLVCRPARVLEHKFVRQILKATGDESILDEPFEELRQGVGFDPRDVEQMAILFDRKTIFSMARIPEGDDDKALADNEELSNNLKQVLLSLHNFHDVFSRFPDHDGPDGDNKGNLSWRVHILPFLEEAPLYDQFHLDEPWDSDHNKTLIERMPDVFRTPDVDGDKGKTSLHGIVGDKTVMSGKGAISIRNIVDGTSNTLLIAVAGADKGEIWTKPGGVEFKKGPPAATLGKIGESFLMGRCDGSVARVPAVLDAETFHRFAQYSDGEVVGNVVGIDGPAAKERLPTWIVRSRKKINREAIFMALRPMGDPIEVKMGSATSYSFGEYILAFPDDQTLVAAPTDLLPKVLNNKKPAGEFGMRLAGPLADVDIAIAADLSNLKPIKDRIAGRVPMAGVVQGINFLQIALDISGSGKYLNDITAATETEATAAQLSALLMGLLQMQKAQIMSVANDPNAPIPAEVVDSLVKLFDKTEIKPEGKQVSYRIPKPDDMDAFYKEIEPALQGLSKSLLEAKEAAASAQRKQHMKMIGLAFHNYHDVYGAFGRYNGDGNPDADKANIGLSWRVQLLPFLEGADLYEKFARDEPWDSETNKALIAEMPDVFKTAGVDKPGYTSIHVFIGKDAPFNDGTRMPRLQDILDGSSNTFLAVEAGPDTAEIWTKPSGLKFTGKDTKKLLGNIGDKFLVLMSDGFVRFVNKEIEDDTLNNLIQHDDGNAVGEF